MVDGSYFNNSFGLGAQPGDRTGVAPISLEAIEQVQVSIAPFDVRQGSFIGAAVNSVTRSGTNRFTASVYHRMRNEDFVGTEARGLAVNPGTFTFRDTGIWASGPIIKNKLFVFGNYENEEEERPLTTFRANTGGEPRRQRHACARVRPHRTQRVPVAELRVRDWPVRRPSGPHSGEALPAEDRLQHEEHTRNSVSATHSWIRVVG